MITNKDNSIQSFSRYEFKYVLSSALAKNIESEIQHFMDYDGYVHPDMGNKYIVRSLYFENRQLTNFNEKVDGIKRRRKYRIRTYSKDKDTLVPVYLEEKGRVNNRTYKERVEIKYSHLIYFLAMDNSAKLLELYPGNELIEKFAFDSIRKRLKPTVLIEYIRGPYVNKYGLLFRLTFDSDIKAQLSTELFNKDKQNYWKLAKPGYTVLEVKFERSIPPWFHRIIQCYNLKRVSISKMVIGMEACGVAKDV